MTTRFAAACAALLCSLALPGAAHAATAAEGAGAWPARPVTLVVPLAPGGSTDSTARLLAQRLPHYLGQPVVVENRAGAGGNVGADHVAKSAADGYTFLFSTTTLIANVTLYANMPLNVQKDLQPVSRVSLIPNVLMVNTKLPVTSLKSFIEYAKDSKTPVYYGSAGNGTSQHLSGSMFNEMAHLSMHHVPYKGGAPANMDLLSGQIQAVFSPLVEVLPFIDSGKLRPLAVTTAQRSPRLPDVPAVAESLPGYEIVLWNGVWAPAGTPAPIVDKMNKAINAVLGEAAVKKTLADQGSTPAGDSPAAFSKLVDAEIIKWGNLVRASGAKVE
ncbi:MULTISPECIES: tripartite tricarboxylate transporter substrate binding protein [unclassified Achromobacter]|uniref:tripartite tricarboxylate transporter substrate binding protein n=1 Tax=unclassified Achromobacter TaxID=2626865 RepID=UPI000B51BF49|nr:MULTISPECIES: tripartite tricarboxylate transporter substrate binding protein [unclassified Achromobacter]OWT70233.1 ABC transporter substrate-binding protein [Achromobacter sp. HZ34]OWT71773.1 ABC transporter substrate-binding protein [Achromobacter sp. HZ28]